MDKVLLALLIASVVLLCISVLTLAISMKTSNYELLTLSVVNIAGCSILIICIITAINNFKKWSELYGV